MTVSSTTNKSGPYNGNGSTSAFAASFKYTDVDDVEVIVTSAAGVETTKVLNTHYTLTAPGDSGTVTFITSPDYRPQTGETVTIRRTVAVTQEYDPTTGGGITSAVIEATFDYVTFLIQQVHEKVLRAPKLRATTTSAAPTFPEPSANAFIAWNAAGTDLINAVAADVGEVAVTPYIATLLDDATATEARTTLGALGGAVGIVDGTVPRADGIGGVTLQGSGVIIDDSNNLLLPTGTAISWNSGDVTITHSANALSFAGASSGYTFDAAINGTLLSASVQATGLNGIDGDQFFIYKEYTASLGGAGHPSGETAVLRAQRKANYSGGTPGNVECAIWAPHDVAAGVANFEWSILAQLTNNATAGENVAIYGQATKASTGPTWGGVMQVIDTTGSANPTTGMVALEIDVQSNGADNNNARLGIDLAVFKHGAGAANTVSHGIRIGAFNQDASQGTFTNGIALGQNVTNGISFNQTGTRGITFGASSSITLGIDFSAATFGAAPIRLAADQKIQLEGTGGVTFGYETSGTKWVFKNAATERVAINTGSGAISVNGTQVVGPRDIGWTAMTGTPDESTAYATGSVTLPQLAGRVMALQTALTTHGLIGA